MFLNDWILANLYNPEYSIDDLATIGELDTTNTQFVSKDKYLSSQIILEHPMFKDDSGNFSFEKFNDYYDLLVARWNEFLNNEFPTGIELDMFDTAANRPRTKVKELSFDIYRGDNPDRVLKGVEGWRTISDRTKSEAEIAQSLAIYDSALNEFRNETPEDYALFNNPYKFITNIFTDPLAVAIYELDEIDENGVQHYKGEKKLNKYGTYYYETLNGKSPIGREVLSAGDILTKEDTVLNHIDFFDSDDLLKSTAGVIAKNIAFIAPMFTPVAPYYYSAIIAKELVTTLPMLEGWASLITGNESEAPEWLNRLAASGEVLSSSSSTHSKLSVFTLENIINLMSDVALQWGLLKRIAQSLNFFSGDKSKLKKAEEAAKKLYDTNKNKHLGMAAIPEEAAKLLDGWKYSRLGQQAMKYYVDPIMKAAESRQKLGGDLALAYMALISNTDVYSSMLEHGTTKEEAAWVALGSTLGMFGVDKFLHLGELFYDDLSAQTLNEGRKALMSEFSEAFKQIYKKGSDNVTKDLGMLKRAIDFGKKAGETFAYNLKNHNLGFVGKSLGEGLEEVTEELVTDFSKTLYELSGKMGVFDTTVKDVGAWDNALERYGMSFLGGTLGGGLFYGVEKFNGFNKHRDRDLVELINAGKASELRRITKDLIAQGKAGSTTLSGIDHTNMTKDGTYSWLSTNNVNESQNAYIGNKVLERIDLLEAIIVGSGTKLNDDLLFDKMVMLDARFVHYKNASYVTGYYELFDKLLKNYIELKDQLLKAGETIEGTPDGTPMKDKITPEQQRNKEVLLAILLSSVDEALKKLNDFLSGDSSLEYTRKLAFALDPVLNSIFLGLNFSKWVTDNYGDLSDIDIEKRVEINKAWLEHVKGTMTSDLDKAFEAFKVLEETLFPAMLEQQNLAQPYKLFYELVKPVFEDPNFLISNFERLINWDDKNILWEDGTVETEEEWANRNNQNTEEEALNKINRNRRIHNLRNLQYLKFVLPIVEALNSVGYLVDSNTNRRLALNVLRRMKDVLNDEVKLQYFKSGSYVHTKPYHLILLGLKFDESGKIINREEILAELTNKFYSLLYDNAISGLSESIGHLSGVIMPRDYSEMFKTDKEGEVVIESLVADTLNKNAESSNIANEKLKAINRLNKQLKEKNDALDALEYEEDDFGELIPIDTEQYNDLSIEISELEKSIESLKKEIVKLVPENLKTKLVPMSNIILEILELDSSRVGVTSWEERGRLKDKITLSLFIDLLNDPMSTLSNAINQKYNNSNTTKYLKEIFNNQILIPYKDSLLGLFSNNLGFKRIEDLLSNNFKTLLGTYTSYLDDVIHRTENNPVSLLYKNLQTTVHSPIEQIFKTITKAVSIDQAEINNINEVFKEIFKAYSETDTINSFLLNNTLINLLGNTQKVLELVSAYIYAASTNPSTQSYFGLNRFINDFIKTHKTELVKEWEPLPEINSNYADVLQNEVNNLLYELTIWLRLSDASLINKSRRLTKAQNILNNLHYNLLNKLKFSFTSDDKSWELFEDEGTELSKDFAEQLQTIALKEANLYDSFQEILKSSGLSILEFFRKSNFWNLLLPETNEITELITSNIGETLEKLTNYDKAIYILSIISDDPRKYYKSLHNFVNDYDNIAPLSVLLNATRIALAAHTTIFKEGIKSLHSIFGSTLTLGENIVHINGVAGAGKTDIVLRAVRDRFGIDEHREEALIIGPTKLQALTLLNTLNEGTSYTFGEKEDSIFEQLVEDWSKIEEDLKESLKGAANKIKHAKDSVTIEGNYFKLIVSLKPNKPINKLIVLKNTIKFKNNHNETLVFVDEAAHLNTLLIAILNKHANEVKRRTGKNTTVFLASDTTQSGYSNGIIENLDTDILFTARTSNLTESLRSSNVLKLENDSKIYTIINDFEKILGVAGILETTDYLNKLNKLVSSLNPRIFMDDTSINGDLTDGIDISEVLPKIPKTVIDNKTGKERNTSIGFIGDEGSEAYEKLKLAGYSNITVLSETIVPGKKFMLGQEFDYVFVESVSFNSNELLGYPLLLLLKRVRTLMSRGREATIFLQDISKIVGKNVHDNIKSKGFNIRNEVENFRAPYLEALSKLELNSSKHKAVSSKIEPIAEEKSQEEPVTVEEKPSSKNEELLDALKALNKIKSNIDSLPIPSQLSEDLLTMLNELELIEPHLEQLDLSESRKYLNDIKVELEKRNQTETKFPTSYEYDKEMIVYNKKSSLLTVEDGVAIYGQEGKVPDILLIATSDNDYIGIFREEDSNKWSIKMENLSGDKDNFKLMLSTIMNKLPENAIILEKTSMSLDGIRVFAQQLKYGFKKGPDFTTVLNGADKANIFNMSEELLKDMSNVTTEGRNLADVISILTKQLMEFGFSELEALSRIKIENGLFEFTIPSLVKMSVQNLEESEEVDMQTSIYDKLSEIEDYLNMENASNHKVEMEKLLMEVEKLSLNLSVPLYIAIKDKIDNLTSRVNELPYPEVPEKNMELKESIAMTIETIANKEAEEAEEVTEKNPEEVLPTIDIDINAIDPEVTEYPELDPLSDEEAVQLHVNNVINEIYDSLEQEEGSEITTIDNKLVVESSLAQPIIGLKTYRKKDKDGKDYENDTWDTNVDITSEGLTLRNLEALVYLSNDDLKDGITKLEDKKTWELKLANIRDFVIFGDPDPEYGKFDPIELGNALGFDLDKGKLFFEIRRATEKDYFGVLNDLNNDFITIDGQKYVISVVLKYEGLRKRGSDKTFTAAFDISLLSDYLKMLNPWVGNDGKIERPRIERVLKKLDEKIKNLRNQNDPNLLKVIDLLVTFKSNLNKSFTEYQSFVENIVRTQLSSASTSYSIELTSEMYEARPMTLLRRRTPRRLGGPSSIKAVERTKIVRDEAGNNITPYPTDHNSFIDGNPNKVVGGTYVILDGHQELLEVISSSILGRVGVPVSSNTNLYPSKLAKLWLNQKNNPDSNTPVVRMLMTENLGLSFEELIRHKILEYEKTLLGKKANKHWRMDVLGVRMFLSLWNTRAALFNFNRTYLNWLTTNKYTDDYVQEIAKLEYDIFKTFGGNPEIYVLNTQSAIPGQEGKSLKDLRDELNKLISGSKVSREDLEAFIHFNTKILLDVPMFRLGYSTGKIHYVNDGSVLRDRGYVRSFNVLGSDRYNVTNANMYTLDYLLSLKYYNLLNIILGLLTSTGIPELNLKGMNTTLLKENGEEYGTHEYIGPNSTNRTFGRGKIHTVRGRLRIGSIDQDETITDEYTVPEDSIFSFFPKVLGLIALKSAKYLEGDSNYRKNFAIINVSTIDNSDKQLDNFIFELAPLFRDGGLAEHTSDTSLFDIFNIAFHGTTENIHEDHAFMYDAPFKYGIKIDPDMMIMEDKENLDLINVSGVKRSDGVLANWTLLKCGTNPMFFSVNAEVTCGGLALVLSELINKGKEQMKPKEVILLEETNTFESFYKEHNVPKELLDSFENYINNNFLVLTEENYNSFLKEHYEIITQSYFVNGISKYEGVDTTSTILNLINLQMLNKNIKLSKIEYVNKQVIFEDVEGKTGIIKYDSQNNLFIIEYNKESIKESKLHKIDDQVLYPVGLGKNKLIVTITHKDALRRLAEYVKEDKDITNLVSGLNNTAVSNFDSYINMFKDVLNENINAILDFLYNKIASTGDLNSKKLIRQIYQYLSFLRDTNCN